LGLPPPTRQQLNRVRSAADEGTDFVLDAGGELAPGDASGLAAAFKQLHLLGSASLARDDVERACDSRRLREYSHGRPGTDAENPSIAQRSEREKGCRTELRTARVYEDSGKLTGFLGRQHRNSS
jgi:hypothetical protein